MIILHVLHRWCLEDAYTRQLDLLSQGVVHFSSQTQISFNASTQTMVAMEEQLTVLVEILLL